MQPQPGYEYVLREEYDTLVGRVGDVESTLHDLNANVMSHPELQRVLTTTGQSFGNTMM
jgi:hypothetical protein